MAFKEENKVTAGHFQIFGTDLVDNADNYLGPEFKPYRAEWARRAKSPEQGPGEFPLNLDIESVSACNLKCIMCPWHGNMFSKYNLPAPKKDRMKMELFKKIIDEGEKYNLPAIKLNYRGEPLLHPQLGEMIRYAKNHGVIEVMFNTNGLALNDARIRKLIDAGLDRILFSFDGATKETYEKIRVGSNYDIVVRNIRRFVEIRDELGLKIPSIRVQMCAQPNNIPELKMFVDMWKDVVNRIGFGLLKDPNEVMHAERFPCPQIFQRLIICYDGEVRLCCGDWNGDLSMPIGNLNEHKSIHDIWINHPYLKKIRETHLAGKSVEIDVCSRCDINTKITNDRIDELMEQYNKRETSPAVKAKMQYLERMRAQAVLNKLNTTDL